MIRPATPDDARAITGVRVRTWRHAYQGIVPDDYLRAMDVETESAKRKLWLAEPQSKCVTLVYQDSGGAVIGFSMSGPLREKLAEYDGEVYAIYVLPEHQGLGVGRKLFLTSLADLKSNGFKSCLVWTLKENSSIHFYQKMGGKLEAEDMITIGKPLLTVAFGWKNLESCSALTGAPKA